uniref:Vitellogenin domain-containing protein n=1 Tax=Anabas testudineus TaxID=64144 RepID=A0A3Q1JYX7_ANATE
MGDSKLCLLLLLSISALAFAQDQPTCLLAKRYKALHKYQYQYEAESMNAINGASPLKNGPKASCIVELEVPQTCSFIIRTTGCSLTEVVDTDAGGNPVFRPAPSSEAFAAEMEKYPLKFVIEGVYDVKLYPEDGETTTILNIKRGIISALAVPLLEEDKNKNMPTIHGKCKTHYQVNAREDIATDITLNRDLSRCDRFVPIGDYTSPLALIAGMRYPLAQLVRSSQTCNYKFDNEKKHMTSGSCTENHILIPFSHKGEYGVTNVGKQELTLVQVFPHNDRVFEHSDIVKGLHMEAVEDKSVIQDKDAVLKLLRELATLPESEGERRANLFHELVTIVRGMKTATLSPAIPEALAVSHVLTYQVLAQCGTPECSSAIMQILRTFDSSSFKIDATVFAMGLLSNPSALLISDMLEMAKYKPSKSVMYALSNVVKRFYNAEGKLIPEIHSVAEFMAKRLGDCSGDDDDTFLTLRVIGNMAPAVVPASPALRAAVIKCVNQPSASLAVQQAAIQVYRLTPVPDNDREVLMQVLLDGASPVQKRIAAYLVLMKDPQPSELVRLTEAISSEQDVQVKSFVISHITNILSSTDPETQELRQKIRDALQGNEIGPLMDGTKFSHNYKTGSVEGNMIFEGTSYLPKEVMLEMTLKAFGYDIDMMEIGIESKGFEPTVDALFGENGFFPDTALKTMYFVSDNVPLSVNEILQNMLPALKKNRMKRQTSKNLAREIGDNINKLMKELENSQSPEAMVYLRLLGNELGYLRTSEMEGMLMAALMTKGDNTIFAHYIFMDNEFFLPTLTGVPLRIALSGTFTPGIKGGLKIARDMNEVTFMPSAAVEFETHFGSHIPEYVNSGLEMHTNIFHESGLNAKIAVTRDQVKLTIPAPTSPTKLIKITNTLVAVTGTELKTIPPSVMDRIDVSKCTSVFAGMNYCTALQYTDAFSQETSPYFPFTGDSKFAVELHPTGEVTEYTATVGYELLREGEEGRQRVDSVKFILRAEGNNIVKSLCFLSLSSLVAQFGKTFEAKAAYHFNNEHFTIAIPLPLGGKSTEEFNFPPVLTTPTMYLPQLGLEIVSMEIPLPEFVIPESLSLSIPLFGKVEASTLMKSNLYNMEASMAVGKDTFKKPRYSATFDFKGTSPLDILSIKFEGLGVLAIADSIKAHLKSSLAHKFIEASFSIAEETIITDKIYLKSSSKIEAMSPFGVSFALEHTGMTGIDGNEISADNNFEGMFKAGPMYGKTISNQSFAIFPFRPEAKFDSTIQFDSTIIRAQNTIAAALANGEFSVMSNTNAFEDILTHVAELSFKDRKLSLKWDGNARALGMKIRNQAEASAGASEVIMRIETNAEHSENQANYLLTASLDSNGSEINSNAIVTFSENKATHKAAVKINKDGLTASGKTTLQSPLSLENSFNVGVDFSKATLSITNRAALANVKVNNANILTITLSIAGLAAMFTSVARFNSQSMRFDHSIRCSIVPFNVNFDAIFNADGEITLYGKHSGQLYGKFLLKAHPLAFASVHECRASVTHTLDNEFSLETTFDNKMDTVLSLQEQKTSFRITSKMNEHAFNHGMSIYNTAERTGIEISSTILTNILNTDSPENQEFTISGFLKYDKNTNVIQFPLIENLPAILENIKGSVAEVLLFIDYDELGDLLEALPRDVSELISELNIEGMINRLKQHFNDFMQESISIEDLKAFQKNLERSVESLLFGALFFTGHVLTRINELPTIPTEIIVLPCFGKLSGEIKFLTPIYTLKMSAEFKNSTENEMAPQFTGFLSSQATSPHFEILNYKLDSTTRIAIPKMSRVVLTETMKFNHLALGLDHQASVTFYGIVNTAVVAVEEGMSASLNTIYNHKVDLPCIDVRCEATVTQKSIAHQHGLTFTLTVDNSGESTINGDKGNHKSNLQLSLTPSTVKLTFSGDTDSNILKVKQQITAESGTFNYFKFNVRNEAEAPAIKNSLLVVSGHGNLYDMKVELKGNHDTELHGEVSGVLSNSINFVARPVEFVYEFQNKGNVMVSIFKSVIAKIDLQNDYSVILRPESQQVATVALARLNDYKIFYNFTLNNNENEAGIFVAMESAGNLHFLTVPFSIPEIDLIFTSTEQTVNADAKIVYQKSQAAPLAYVMGLIQIPHVGNVITELSFKSAIINLNANAGLYAEDNLVFRLGATTVSVFEGLKAKLHGTTSLTAKRGLKLASSLSLENRHIECSHNSTISISPETFETAVSVVTVAKIDLPILNLETKQSLVANTQTKPNAISSLTMKGDFNIPVINTVGTAEAAHNLKLDGTFKYISMESTTKAKLDGTVLTNSLVWEFLDNEVNVYLNHEGLRSTSKVAADLKLNHGTTKVIAIYVNENLDIEASLSHVYAVLKYTGNNEAKLPNFNTKGKHTAQATIDLAPTSSLTANVEIDIFQPSNLGDLIIQEKTVAEVTVPKQKISTNAKFSTSSTANIENDALSMISKFTMTGNDLTMEVDHVITQALR